MDGTEKMVELIQSYPELCNSIERVANRPFEANIDVRADDFPVRVGVVCLELYYVPSSESQV